ncbi:MAG: glycoside hydrolase family 26 protein, partial [Sphingomonas oligoaromativorans]
MIRSLMTAAFLAAPLAFASPASADPLMGVYKGAGCDGAGRLPRYEGVMGRKLDSVTDFFSSESWDSLLSGATWALGCWQG